MKVCSINPLFLANDSVMLGQDDGEQEEEQPKMLAKEYKRKGYGKSFATVQKLATHSRCCPDAKAFHEGQQEPTEPKQTKEEKESPYHDDGDSKPNEILRHIPLQSFPE
jgi:hypothetical protein